MFLLLANNQRILLRKSQSLRQRRATAKAKGCEIAVSHNVSLYRLFHSKSNLFIFYFSSKGLFHQISLFLLHCNSAMNPMILYLQSENYRTGFKEIIQKAVGKFKNKAAGAPV